MCIKKNVVKPPSSLKYNLEDPEKHDYSQFQEGLYLLEYFKNKKNGTFIEVGALDGEFLSNTLILEKELGWTGLLIEPNPEQYKLLSSKNRKAFHANCCLSKTTTPTEAFLEPKYRRGEGTRVITRERIYFENEVPFSIWVKCYPPLFFDGLRQFGNSRFTFTRY
ncbi:hypothetical protein Anas_07473 [Armadillidium nasatum]|uniref:Methyltransferase FkbM domain-containing protein n=1 Tax=Armadillidium nasatum TaxID=96803 RepID=A0A5N5SKT9_9CRUS|nr:hypothetical protein Anas_07473 [Armadillidium nasatum]